VQRLESSKGFGQTRNFNHWLIRFKVRSRVGQGTVAILVLGVSTLFTGDIVIQSANAGASTAHVPFVKIGEILTLKNQASSFRASVVFQYEFVGTSAARDTARSVGAIAAGGPR
jgi:hypothetical protein